jgi:hypothetical protein
LAALGLKLWGTPEYEDTDYNDCFPKKAVTNPFHRDHDENFVHRLATDWEQPHLNIRGDFFKVSAKLLRVFFGCSLCHFGRLYF